MKLLTFLALSAAIAAPAIAEGTRQLDAHEHGVGQLDIAFDEDLIAMELHAPGADIVGFEYAAESADDRAAIDAAVATLARPLDLFVLPDAAGCSVLQASAELESEQEHEEHSEVHAGETHGHDEHASEEHAADEHTSEEHAHGEHAEEDHEEHANEAGHTEFHAEYLLICADPKAVTEITFAYFATFPNALEVEVQVISENGATSFEVERASPDLDLRGMF